MKRDYEGKRFGSLIAIKRLKGSKWDCVCDCGNTKVIATGDLPKIKSCGCVRKKVSREKSTKHGVHGHPIYFIWKGIRSRCYNETNSSYPRYGKKGVYMCAEWKDDPRAFIDWCIANGWRKGLHIDKDIKVPGNKCYSPDTCMIVTPARNAKHTSRIKLITHNDKTMNQSEWAYELNVSRSTISTRLKKGLTVEGTSVC